MENYKKKESNRTFTYSVQFDVRMIDLYAFTLTPRTFIPDTARVKNGYTLAMSNITLDRVKFEIDSCVCYDSTANGGIFNTNPYYFLIIRNTTGYIRNMVEYTGSGSDDTRLCTIIAQDIPAPMTLAGVLGNGSGYAPATFDINNLDGNFTLRVTDNGYATEASTVTIAFNIVYTEYITIV